MSEYRYNLYGESDDFYETYEVYNYKDVMNDEITGWKEVYENCITPSFFQISYYVLPFVAVNSFFCFISKIQARFFPWLQNITHACSFGCGLFLLYMNLEHGRLHLLKLFISVYILIKVSFIEQKLLRFDYFISFYVIMYLTISEILEKDPEEWHHVRGVLMIASMKLVSLTIDMRVNRSLRDQFSIISYLGYVFYPGNCIFGPWTSFAEYLTCFTSARERFRLNYKYLGQIMLNMILSIICLLVSNCADTFFSQSWKWTIAYGTAFSFRMSHYFISFLSQAAMVSAGMTPYDSELKSSNVKRTRLFGYAVVKPWSIEFPRSLVHIVVAWNVPMHDFLKQYIFRPMKPHGTFVAIFATYVSSSLLHGLNFQLWATLLTLGVWSYIELNVRNKLSQIFSACVLVKNCSVPCTRHLGQNKSITIFINSIFIILCVMNLTYLGAIFDANSQLQTEGYSFGHTLEKWRELDYFSHWLLVLGFIFNRLI